MVTKVRIHSAYIPFSPHTNSLQAGSAAFRPQKAQAIDSDRNRSGPQVIDAEYVEFYQPTAADFSRERQNLDNRLEPEHGKPSQTLNSDNRTESALNSYQCIALGTPPPGSHLDVFA